MKTDRCFAAWVENEAKINSDKYFQNGDNKDWFWGINGAEGLFFNK